MNLDRLIVELIQDNKNVIVPGLGSFIKSEDTTSYTVLFNQFLKYNDKLLQKKIESISNCSDKDAIEMMQAYTNSILSQLEVEGNYLIEGLGVLLSKSGKLDFQFTSETDVEEKIDVHQTEFNEPAEILDNAFESENIQNDNFEKEKDDVNHAVNEDESTPNQEAADPEKPVQDATAFKNANSEEEEELVEERKQESEKITIQDNPIVIEDVSSEFASETSDEITSDDNTDPVANPSKQDQNKVPQVKRKKNKTVLWFGTISICCGLTLLCWLRWDEIITFINSDDQKIAFNSTEESPKANDVAVTNKEEIELDTVSTVDLPISPIIEQIDTPEVLIKKLDTIQITTSIPSKVTDNTKTQNPVTISASTKLYHIIGGSFSEEGNALRFAENLNEKGYSTADVIGKRNEMYTVSYGGYQNKQEAKKKADEIMNTGESEGVWILYY